VQNVLPKILRKRRARHGAGHSLYAEIRSDRSCVFAIKDMHTAAYAERRTYSCPVRYPTSDRSYFRLRGTGLFEPDTVPQALQTILMLFSGT